MKKTAATGGGMGSLATSEESKNYNIDTMVTAIAVDDGGSSGTTCDYANTAFFGDTCNRTTVSLDTLKSEKDTP